MDAGGGHRAAAAALRLAMEEEGGWCVRLVNLQELLDPIDLARKLTGMRTQDVYNLMLRRGWTLGAGQGVRLLQGAVRLLHRREVRLLEAFWRPGAPDLVVSLAPHFNRALAEGLERARPGARFVTILTDLADYPPHFWIEPEAGSVICGSERAVAQARALGLPPERIFQVSGMILHPRFYQAVVCDRRAERRRRWLDPDLPTGLVMFGGQGSRAMLEIGERLDNWGPFFLQLIFICGRNPRLARALRRPHHRLRRYVVGYTDHVPFYMHLADFFIGKPGPGSISEALAMGLPLIVERNARTLPQERYNAEWVMEQQLGVVVRGPAEVPGAVRALLERGNLGRFRARVAAIHNRAVYEIPPLLRHIATRQPAGAPAETKPGLSEHELA